MDSAMEVEARTGARAPARLPSSSAVFGGRVAHPPRDRDRSTRRPGHLLALRPARTRRHDLGTARLAPRALLALVRALVAFVLFLAGHPAARLRDPRGPHRRRSVLPDLIILPGYRSRRGSWPGSPASGRRNADDLDAVLDAVVAGLAVLMLAWVFLVTPALAVSRTCARRSRSPWRPTRWSRPSCWPWAPGGVLRGRQPPLAMWLCSLAMLSLLSATSSTRWSTPRWDVPIHVIDVPYVAAFCCLRRCCASPVDPPARHEPLLRRRRGPRRGRCSSSPSRCSSRSCCSSLASPTAPATVAVGSSSLLLVSVGVVPDVACAAPARTRRRPTRPRGHPRRAHRSAQPVVHRRSHRRTLAPTAR